MGKDILIFILVFILLASLFLTISLVDYNYQINRCNNLNSKQSNYDFTERIEIDANFNESCYFFRNHPLALPFLMILPILISILLSFLVVAFAKLIKEEGQI